MNTFAPEFARYWLDGRSARADEGVSVPGDDELEALAQQEALEALAERVSAARSVV